MTHPLHTPLDPQPQLSADGAVSAMPRTSITRPQLFVIGALIVGYAALSHYSSSTPDAKGLGAALSIGPVLLIALVLVWRWTRPWIALCIAAGLTAFLYRYWEFVENNFEIADLVEQAGAYALIAWSFARSLIAGRVPLMTQLMKELHSTLLPAEIIYTRRATLAWAVFYLLLAGAIVLLHFQISQSAWSFFVNFATFGLIIAGVLVDFVIRRAILPRRPGHGVLTMLRRSLIG